MPEPKEAGLKCRCGLIVPRKQMIENGYLCPDCRLARILTEHDRPVPETMIDVARDTHPNKRKSPAAGSVKQRGISKKRAEKPETSTT